MVSFYRHFFVGGPKIQIHAGAEGPIYAVRNNKRNRDRLNRALAGRPVTVKLCFDGTTLITVPKLARKRFEEHPVMQANVDSWDEPIRKGKKLNPTGRHIEPDED